MTDLNSFDELLRREAQGYNAPTEPDRDAMWARIQTERARRAHEPIAVPRRFSLTTIQSLAASLLLVAAGIGIGRISRNAAPVSTSSDSIPAVVNELPSTVAAVDTQAAAPTAVPTVAVTGSAPRDDAPRIAPAILQQRLRPYLVNSAELITTFRLAAKRNQIDPSFAARSTQLLGETRALEDSVAGGDPSLRRLLADLDLVLMQIAQYSARSANAPNPVELDLIEDSIKRRGLLAELQSRAVPQEPRHTPNEAESTR